jgi:hypothetical protein
VKNISTATYCGSDFLNFVSKTVAKLLLVTRISSPKDASALPLIKSDTCSPKWEK